MQTHQTIEAQQRLRLYLVIAVVLILGNLIFQNIHWQSTARTHTFFEAAATFLALFVGVLALVRYYSKKSFVFLLIGTSFPGTAVLDAYHAYVTSTTFAVSVPTTPPSLIPWSWMASRTFLAILLGVIGLAWRSPDIFKDIGGAKQALVFISVGGLTLASFLFFAFVPLPRQIYYPELPLHRPWEFIPALIFLAALVETLRQRSWLDSNIAHWLVIALIINIFGHVPFLATSSQLFDSMYNMAHVLKIMGYSSVLIGLLISTYFLFKQAEESIVTMEQVNIHLQREINEREQAEAALRESETKFRTLAETTSALIFIYQGDRLRYANPAALATIGYSQAEILSLTFWDILHPEFRQGVKERELARQSGENVPVRYEFKILNKSGDPRWVDFTTGMIEFEGIQAVLGTALDITERKRMEETLIRARDQALEASRLKTELLAKVSHELRTPLSAIFGLAEMLELNIYGHLSKDQQHAVAEIIDSSEYLANLVGELLDQAQLEAGQLKLNITAFTPTDVIDDTLSKMTVLAEAKGLTLGTNVAADLPATLSGDPARLQQILVNLVSNAVKFTPAGTVQVRLYRPNALHWALEVSDTGIGIPVEAQTYIFEPFGQVDGSMTRSYPGAGLGLSIVKQLTTLMGGQIRLKSKMGQGSTFTVLLPLEPPLRHL